MADRKRTLTIRFSKADVIPPVYLAGSFSDPAWQPQEMQYTVDKEHGKPEYHQEVEVEEGKEYQYKFRIGDGDWWLLNEDSPTVTDDAGNRNNLLAIPVYTEPIKQEEPQQAALIPETSSPSAETVERMDSKAECKDAGETNGIAGEEINPVLAKPEEFAEPSAADDVPLPTLVVEKTDSAPRYGDDFGPDATVGQKDARSRRASDARPDQVIIRDQTSTPDLANVAAEVADSAAILDRSKSNTPAISNEEAGQIGYRRMSMTPIQDVADIAAEVADSAAIIDEGSLKIDELPSYVIEEPEEEAGSGTVTPWEERVPLFEHECLKRPEGGETEKPSLHPDYDHSPKRSYELPEEIDLNDPTIEDFPCEREAILKQLRTTATRLSEDETRFDGEPYSPIVGSTRRGENGELPQPSPRLLSSKEGCSPSLKSISEDDAHEGVLAKLPSTHHGLGNSGHESIGNGRREPLPTHQEETEEDAQENDFPAPPPESVEPIVKETQELSTIPPTVSVEPVPEGVAATTKAIPASGIQNSVESIPEEVAAPSTIVPAFEVHDLSSETPADRNTVSVDEQTMDGSKHISPDPIKLPVTPCIFDNSKQLGESSITNEVVTPQDGPVVQVVPATPAVSGNTKQLSKPEDKHPQASEEPREVVAPEEGPIVTVQPATPGSSLKARTSDSVQKSDTAKATAIEEESGHSQLTNRKTSPTPDRPLTPQSMRSTGKEPRSRNFLKSFLRLIFVDWIGGLIMRLCGGNRRALFAITALTLVTVAPALYFLT